MPIAAYAVAIGCNFPEIVEEYGRCVFVFSDENGEAEAAYNEYPHRKGLNKIMDTISG